MCVRANRVTSHTWTREVIRMTIANICSSKHFQRVTFKGYPLTQSLSRRGSVYSRPRTHPLATHTRTHAHIHEHLRTHTHTRNTQSPSWMGSTLSLEQVVRYLAKMCSVQQVHNTWRARTHTHIHTHATHSPHHEWAAPTVLSKSTDA